MSHVCEIGEPKCSAPATHCILCDDPAEPGGPITVWMCEAHYNDPSLRKFFELLWDKVEY